MQPFQFQETMIQTGRGLLRNVSRICFQAPTGAGKTVIGSELIRLATKKDLRCWFVVPRNKLLIQASKTLSKFNIPHGKISAKMQESNAYRVHVVSKDTLIRRYQKIENPPDVLIFDECHIALDRQIEIYLYLLFKSTRPLFVFGFSATPERLDGRGLSELYQTMVKGPWLHELVEMGFLSMPRYFCPPLEGLDTLHRIGTEVNSEELDNLLEERKVYGKAIDHYEKYANGKPALMFTRSVASAKKTAQNFRDRGHNFEAVDGSMTEKILEGLFDKFSSGEIQGLVSCDLLTYGVDLPTIEYIGILRPTYSKALHYQIIGRGLRISEGKDSCIIMDHVNNYMIHGHPLTPYEWNFDGKEKRKVTKADPEKRQMLCPYIDFMYCEKASCVGCPHNEDGVKKREELHEVEVELEEVKAPIKLNERPTDERREIQIRINQAIDDCAGAVKPGPIGRLLKIAEELGRNPMWVYWRLSEGRISVNVPLLHEIGRQKGYKNPAGWAWYQGKEIKKKLGR